MNVEEDRRPLFIMAMLSSRLVTRAAGLVAGVQDPKYLVAASLSFPALAELVVAKVEARTVKLDSLFAKSARPL